MTKSLTLHQRVQVLQKEWSEEEMKLFDALTPEEQAYEREHFTDPDEDFDTGMFDAVTVQQGEINYWREVEEA